MQWRGRALEAVLFDLDGTLLDTAADIAEALNRALAERGWPPLAPSEVRRMIGRGSPMLIERAAASQSRALDEAAKAALLERFFHHYGYLEESGEFKAEPYAGAAECLRVLHAAGLRIAVVTNKHERFATGLLQALALSDWVDCVVGGDSCPRRKPDPAPLLFACEQLARYSGARAHGRRFHQRRAGGARRKHSGDLRTVRLQRRRGSAAAPLRRLRREPCGSPRLAPGWSADLKFLV